jgi:branched-chain amino acid transport system substrate-binding protein
MNKHQIRTLCLVGVTVVAAAACGTRIPHKDVVASSDGVTKIVTLSGSEASAVADQGTAVAADGAAPTDSAVQRSGPLRSGPIVAGPTSASATSTAAAAGTTTKTTKTTGTTTTTTTATKTQAGAAKAPIPIGMIGNFSGLTSDGASTGRDAISAWADMVNATGGVLGHPIQLFVADDAGDGTTSLKIVKDLVENKHVVAFVGSLQYDTMTADEPYLRSKGVPVVGGDGNSSVSGKSPVIFPMGADAGAGAYVEGKIAVDAGKPKVGIIYCAESDACSAGDAQMQGPTGVAQAGAEVVYEAQVSIAQPDYTAECLDARQRGVQTLLVFLDQSGVTRVADSCGRQDYRPFYGSGSGTDVLGNNANLNNNYQQLSSVFVWTQNETPSQRAYQSFISHYELPGDANTTIVWASAALFSKALSMITGAVTSQGIISALDGLHEEALDGLIAGPISFKAGAGAPGGKCQIEQVLVNKHLVMGNNGRAICKP